ncbi:hypothetical protein, partial [Paraburkholderia kururiensis]|uniref:hypothetical protein n=1 Tax=Paraburkholderia kururiensis TaxID=984307 RepID=UPI001F32A748
SASPYSHRRGEVSISMNTLTAEFDAYVESCFPLTVIVNQPQPAYIAEPRHPAAIASFFQRGSRVGKISLHSSVLKNGIYEKIRKFEPPDGDWFLPFPGSPRAVMAELANGNVADLTIDSLSRAGIRLKNDIRVEADAVRRVVLYGKNIGYIPLPILGGQFLAEGILELRLAPLERQYDRLLREFIRRYCYLSRESTPRAATVDHRQGALPYELPAFLSTAGTDRANLAMPDTGTAAAR